VSGFAKGGSVNTPKRGLVNGPGGYAGTEVVDIYEQIKQRMPARKPQLSISDYLQIASAGADILGAPSEGGGIGGALRTAAKPLSALGKNLASGFSAQEKADSDLTKSLVGAQADYNIGVMKANKPFEIDVQVKYLEEYWNPKIKAETDPIKQQELINKKEEEKRFAARGGTLASKYKVFAPKNVELATEIVKESLEEQLKAMGIKRELTADEISTGVSKYLSNQANSFAGFAEGGQVMSDVNMETITPKGMEDVNVATEEQIPIAAATEEQPAQLSYDELRARLPQEITDDIVNLLANSYEALADFAQIATQTDVDTFNSKYEVELVLPQEA
jgi:hypothetical protein